MRLTLIFFAILFIAAALIYALYYNKPHRDIQKEAVDFEMSADELIDQFATDESAAHGKFNEKVIGVSGKIKQVIEGREDFTIVLLEASGGLINCEFNEKADNLMNIVEAGKIVKIKGLYIGYNDLLGEIQLKKCTLEKQ